MLGLTSGVCILSSLPCPPSQASAAAVVVFLQLKSHVRFVVILNRFPRSTLQQHTQPSTFLTTVLVTEPSTFLTTILIPEPSTFLTDILVPEPSTFLHRLYLSVGVEMVVVGVQVMALVVKVMVVVVEVMSLAQSNDTSP